MFKGTRMQYIIKSVPSDNPKALEDLLNEMSEQGWDLYSMHEVEVDEGYQYNCIFATENAVKDDEEEPDVVNITTFRSQMEKMLSSSVSPYDSCKEIQEKIKEQRKKIAKIKTQLEAQSEAPVSKNRKDLNEQISKGLRELDELRQNLVKVISPESMYSKIHQDKLAIRLSEEALELVNPDSGGVLIAETVKIRQKLAEELGYVIPKIVFEDDDSLSSYEFSIRIRGLDVLKSSVYPGYLMFFDDELKLDKKQKGAIYTVDEITGRKIVWIEDKKTKDFWQNGLKPEEFIARLLESVVIKNVEELLDYSDINKYMEIVGQNNLFLIENIIPDFISVAEVRYLLASLLREEVSIKDIIYIFEKLNDFSDEPSKEELLSKLRLTLSKHISKKIANGEGIIQALELTETTYNKLFSKVDAEDDIVRVEGRKIEKVTNSILKKAKQYNLDFNNLVILTPVDVRHIMFMVLSQYISNIRVIAKEEITNEYTVEVLGEI